MFVMPIPACLFFISFKLNRSLVDDFIKFADKLEHHDLFIFQKFSWVNSFAKFKRMVYMTKYAGIVFLLAFISCRQDDMTFEIGNDYVNIKTSLRYIDSLMVNTYTVSLDSIPTSGNIFESGPGTVLAGNYHDPEFGDIESKSYFRLGLPLNRNLPNDAVYDSVQLVLVYNNYYAGDTLDANTIHVHRLDQSLKARTDGYIYNTSSFAYNPEVLGMKTFSPRPFGRDSLKITLDSTFGRAIFDMMMDKDERITNLENFLNYLKGVVLTGEAGNGVILGFKISDAVPLMRLYYHYFDFETLYKQVDFPVIYSDLQFNQIAVKNPLVDFPVLQKYKMPAVLTDNTTFVQGGTGIVTRIEIPYLRNILSLHENIRVLGAELVLEPLRNSYRDVPLAEQISLFYTDKLNRRGTPVYTSNTNFIQVANLVIDDIFQEETHYTFDVTDFVNFKLSEESDDIPALLLTISPEDFYKTVDRVILGSQKNTENKIKLKIYYMNY